MGRSTFEGPVLSGDNRFGPLRNVGYAMLAQHTDINLANITPNTASFGTQALFADVVRLDVSVLFHLQHLHLTHKVLEMVARLRPDLFLSSMMLI